MYTDRYLEMYSVLPSVQPALDSLGEAVVQHPNITVVMVVCAFAAASLLLVLYHGRATKTIDEVEEMKKRAILDQKYADAFGDALFDMLCRDEIDRHEYKRACRRFGIAYRLSDLLVRKNPKRGLKYRVKNNCAEMHATPSIAGKIPGPKPGEDTPAPSLVVQTKRKVWVVAGKALLRRKPA